MDSFKTTWKNMNLPNKLTLVRVLAVPAFIVLYMLNMYWVSLIVFVAASITDMFDGMIARKKNLITNFGKIMDPLADKVLVYSAFCLFIENGTIKAWMLVVILAREFAIAGMRAVSAAEGKVLAAGLSGKVKTVLQMIAVPVIILGQALPQYPWIQSSGLFCFYAALLMTLYSGYEYIVNNKDVFSM